MTVLIAWQHMSRPVALEAGVVARIHCAEHDGRLYRGIVTTPRFDGSPSRFIICRALPDFGAIRAADHRKRVHRVGVGAGAFMQFDNDSQLAELIAGRSWHALDALDSSAVRLALVALGE